MKKNIKYRIKLSEGQFKRIFLGEQEKEIPTEIKYIDQPPAIQDAYYDLNYNIKQSIEDIYPNLKINAETLRDASVVKAVDKYLKENPHLGYETPDDEKNTTDPLDYKTYIPPPAVSDSYADLNYDIKQQSERGIYNEPERPEHGWDCNEKQIRNCAAEGLWADSVTKKGAEWDRIFKKGYKDSNTGEWRTWLYGHWDNDDYTKCWCIGKASISQGDGRTKSKEELAKHQAQHITNISNFQDLNPIGLDKYILDHRHEFLDLLAVAVLILPGGFFISSGIEFINARVYYNEGDIAGVIGSLIAGVAIPGLIGAGSKLLKTDASKIAKAIIKYNDKIHKGINPTKAMDEVAAGFSHYQKKQKDIFKNIVNKPEELQKYISTRGGWTKQNLKNVVKQLPEYKSTQSLRKKIKQEYAEEFLADLPLKTRAIITGVAGGIWGIATWLGSGGVEESVDQMVVDNNLDKTTSDGQQVSKLIADSEMVEKVKHRLEKLMEYYGPDSPYDISEEQLEDLLVYSVDSEILIPLNKTIKNLSNLPLDHISSDSLSKIVTQYNTEGGVQGLADNFKTINKNIDELKDNIGNKNIIKLTDAEGSELAKNDQEEIKRSPMVYIKGDSTWEYAKYKEYWFARKRGSSADDDWMYLKQSIDKSTLEKTYKNEDNRWAQPSESEIKALIDAW